MGQLKLSEVKKRVKELEKKEKFYLDKENDEYIYYYPKFSDTKINELIEELYKSITYCQENNLDNLNTDEEIARYLLFLIIKHFTSFKSEVDNKPFDTHYASMEMLEEVGLYRIFLNYMFDPAEVNKVLDRKNEIEKLGETLIAELEKNSLNEELDKLQVVNTLGK